LHLSWWWGSSSLEVWTYPSWPHQRQVDFKRRYPWSAWTNTLLDYGIQKLVQKPCISVSPRQRSNWFQGTSSQSYLHLIVDIRY